MPIHGVLTVFCCFFYVVPIQIQSKEKPEVFLYLVFHMLFCSMDTCTQFRRTGYNGLGGKAAITMLVGTGVCDMHV